MSSSPVLLEFFGLPAAGKSTLSLELSRMLGKSNIRVASRAAALPIGQRFRNIARLAPHLTYTDFVVARRLHRCWSARGANGKSFPFRWIFKLCLSRHIPRLVRAGCCDLLILDQWLIQDLVASGMYRHQDQHALTGTVEQLYIGNSKRYYCFLRIEPEAAARRILARSGGTSCYDSISDPQLIAMKLREEIATMERLVPIVNASLGPCLELCGEDDLHSNASALRKFLGYPFDVVLAK